jgi:hypothetical protein
MSADTKKVPARPESPSTEQKPEKTPKKSGLHIKTHVKAGPGGDNQDGNSSGVSDGGLS